MRISDWSSDVCSSDLCDAGPGGNGPARKPAYLGWAHHDRDRAAAVRGRNDAGGRTERGGATGDRAPIACRAGADRGGAWGDDGREFRPVRPRNRTSAPSEQGVTV